MKLKVAVILFLLNAISCNGLNTSCDPTELEQMDLKGLLEKADISQNCSNAAADALKRKLTDEDTITVEIVDRHRISFGTGSVLFDEKVKGFEDVQNTLKHFGHLIQRLKFQISRCRNNSEIVENSAILRAINHYCSKTLHAFEIYSSFCALNIFNEIEGPFQKLVDLRLDMDNRLQTNNVKLNEVFPQVKKIDFLSLRSVTDPAFFHFEFPNLEEFLSNFFLFYGTQPSLRNFIGKNPQIKIWTQHEPTPDDLQAVDELLPNLEKLVIVDYVFEITNTDQIVFKHDLRELRFDCYFCMFYSFHKFRNATFQFLSKYKNVQKFTIGDFLKDSEMYEIPGTFAHLPEAELSIQEDVRVESLVQFIQTRTKLNRLTLNRQLSNGDEFKLALESQLGGDFYIKKEITHISVDYNAPHLIKVDTFVIDRKIPVSNSTLTIVA